MKDRQRLFLDKIVNLLVDDTILDYDKGTVQYPFHISLYYPLFTQTFPPSPPVFFSTYCKNQFGLTDEEIDYVWDQYKTFIKDKISKREP